MRAPETLRRIDSLLLALGIEAASFHCLVEWTLSEHLVLESSKLISPEELRRPDALRIFRERLLGRTGLRWSFKDTEALFSRVQLNLEKHYREPISTEDALRLLAEEPLECAWCKAKPPDVKLHMDHILPASRGGSSRRDNLQFLCERHNLEKSNKLEVSDPWLELPLTPE